MTKNKIKKTALKLYGAYGYEGTTMNEIAKEVGIKKPSLYAHFLSKEDILKEIFNDVITDYSGHLHEIVTACQNRDTYYKLLHIFIEFINYFEKNQEKKCFWNRIYMFPPESIKESVFKSIMDAEYGFIKAIYMIFNSGMRNNEIREGNIEDMVMLYYYMLTGFLTCSGFGSEDDFEKRIAGCWNVYWEGIKK